jgi:hypothetical protein
VIQGSTRTHHALAVAPGARLVHLWGAMSAAPDPADLAPSRDLAAYGKRPLFTAGFFAWISLCVICVVAGAAAGRFGVMLAPPAKTEAPLAEAPSRPTSALGALAPPATPAAAAPTTGSDGALDARVTRLESGASRTSDAATEALAAAALSTAAEGSAPFDQDLAAYERLAPADPDLRALAPLAARGAPSRAELADVFPDLASQAAAASRQPARNAGFLSRLWAQLGRVVVVRRIDPGAPGVDGVLARAEAQVAGGDLEAALHTLAALPPAARPPLADWSLAASHRIEIDRRIESLRARALAGLAAQPAPQAPRS